MDNVYRSEGKALLEITLLKVLSIKSYKQEKDSTKNEFT